MPIFRPRVDYLLAPPNKLNPSLQELLSVLRGFLIEAAANLQEYVWQTTNALLNNKLVLAHNGLWLGHDEP